MSQQASKRSACDRCRAQKLRCPQTEPQSNEPCARCARAGAICVTSSARPLGRPRTIHQDGSKVSKMPSATGLERSTRTRELVADTPRKVPRLAATTSTWDPPEEPPDLLECASSHSDRTLSWMLNEGSSLFSGIHLPEEDGGIDPLCTLQPDKAVGAGMKFNQHTSNDTYNNDLQNWIPDVDTLGSDYPECNDLALEMNRKSSEPPNGAEALIGLARLNESITRQLARAKMFPWRASAAHGACSERHQGTGANGVAEVLQSTSEFINILRKIFPASASALSRPSLADHRAPSLPDSGISACPSLSDGQLQDFSPTSSRTVSTASPLSMSTVLLLLSSYIQLLQLYDTIFHHVYDLFSETPSHVMGLCPGQAQSHFRVMGLDAIDGHLHVKILIQVIEHHLESLETLIDLPADFRLSEPPNSSKGILSNMNLSELVQIIMTQIEECPQNPGKSVVESLRSGIKRVKGLL